MKEKLEIKNLDDLYEAVLCLETVEECRLFFKDLCTIPELKALSQRFQVAKMLTKDLGTILVGEDAVKAGLINEVGGISHAFNKIKELMNKEE